MNENINLVEILKDCPKGTKFYSSMYGELIYSSMYVDSSNSKIYFIDENSSSMIDGSPMVVGYYRDGRLYDTKGECTIFPSKDQRDWSKFVAPWLKKERDKDKLIQELGEYKVKYTQEVLEKYINSMSNKDDERLRKTTIAFLKDFAEQGYENATECIDWLKKQSESSQTNERAWLYLVSDVLTWKDGIGQYLDDPRVQELAKRLCSEYAQKLYNNSNSSNTGKNEQKSADKIEPKFHKGDWITIDKPCQIININDNGNYIVQYCNDEKTHELSKNFCESYFHIWAINDAKDGDVLALSWLEDKNLWEKIIIFKKYHSEGIKGLYSIPCVEGYGKTFKNGKMAFTDEEVPYYSKTWTCNLHPATKEQRGLLFQKIKETGYKWNTETNTFEKLVEPKFKAGDKIVNSLAEYMVAPGTQGIISEITDDKYIFTDGSYIFISNQDSWELVPDKKPKFDPKTLKPFDKVIARLYQGLWCCELFSFIEESTNLVKCCGAYYTHCVPYNDETKHLVGTTTEAPEYYRYWEN